MVWHLKYQEAACHQHLLGDNKVLMKNINKLSILILFLNLFSFSAYAWNSMGHRIIGEIAYQHLTPKTKETVDDLIDYMSNAYPYSSTFQTANGWADYIKQEDIHVFDSWHYYDKPYSADSTPTPKIINSPNLLWALNQSIMVLKSSKSNQYEKALFLRFLLHFVEDAHQPLHCINRYSQRFSNGDAGGNLFLLSSNNTDIDNNLHGEWDSGLGLFDKHCGILSSKSKSRKAKCFAKQFQEDYPENYFGQKTNDLNPQDWMDESYKIAVTNAYDTAENSAISQVYIQKNQPVIEQQMTLAGYRLANLLNLLFS
jgi:hypothetical protein